MRNRKETSFTFNFRNLDLHFIRTENDLALNPILANIVCGANFDAMVTVLGGNEHNILGLVRHPRPFDFVLPEQEDLPLDEGAEILPYQLVVETVRRQIKVYKLLRVLRDLHNGPMVEVESPPPVPSADHIHAYPKTFADEINNRGVASRFLRYKLWRVRSVLVREFCETIGVEFLRVPSEALDAEGMLLPEGWNADPTHGNAWYGSCILRALDQQLSNHQQRHSA
jgi:hypothetical protein